MADTRATHDNRTVIIVGAVIAVLVVVGLVLWQTLGSDDDTSTPAAAPETPAAGECLEPPAPPTSPKQYDAAPDPSVAEDAVWTATVSTTCGDIVLELDGTKAPQTVASFLTLAEDGFWDDSPCHRLVTSGIFVLQCGDPTGTGSGGPGYGFGMENAPADGSYPPGTLAMARTEDPNSNGSQFFIVYEESQIPDPTGYSIFGKVTQGMDIVERIAEQGVAADGTAPAQPISILDITVDKA